MLCVWEWTQRSAWGENRDVLKVAYFDMRIITIRKYNPHIFHAMKNSDYATLLSFVICLKTLSLGDVIFVMSWFEELCFCVNKHIWEKLELIRALLTKYECLRSYRMWRRVTRWFVRSNGLIFEGTMAILRGKSTFKMRPTHSLEMSDTNHPLTRHLVPEKRRPEVWLCFIESGTRLTMRPICFIETSNTHHSVMRCHRPKEQKYQLHCC